MYTDLIKLTLIATAAGLCFSGQMAQRDSSADLGAEKEVAMVKCSRDTDAAKMPVEEDEDDENYINGTYSGEQDQGDESETSYTPPVKERKSAAQKARESEENWSNQ